MYSKINYSNIVLASLTWNRLRKYRLILRRYPRGSYHRIIHCCAILYLSERYTSLVIKSRLGGENETTTRSQTNVMKNSRRDARWFSREEKKYGTYDMATRQPERRPSDEEKTKSVSGQIARRNVVRRHVTVTRAFQLIRNKRCQRQTNGNRC